MTKQQRWDKYQELHATFMEQNDPLIDRWFEVTTQEEKDAIDQQSTAAWEQFNQAVDQLYAQPLEATPNA